MIRLLLILLITALCGCHQAYFGTINIGADAPLVESHSIVYDREHALSVDIYRATDTPANAPLILFFYGGTWRYGERAWYRFVGESLADHGFVVMIPDYRTAPDVPDRAFRWRPHRRIARYRCTLAGSGRDETTQFPRLHRTGRSLRLPADLEPAHEAGLP